MIDPYEKEERLAIQEADGIAPSDDHPKGGITPHCEAIERLKAHRKRVLADKAAKYAKKYGIDRKTRSGGD